MFVFKDYTYDQAKKSAHFFYQNEGIDFEEEIQFSEVGKGYDQEVLDRALFLAFLVIGTSYYKTFPSVEVQIKTGQIDAWQAEFLNHVYQGGMSQFAFENDLTRADLVHFVATGESSSAVEYKVKDKKPLVLQSGGKDSLLLAQLLSNKKISFTPSYISSVDTHPRVLDSLGEPLVRVKRILDHGGFQKAAEKGGRNGHVPVTYIVLAIALVQAVLQGKDTVLTAIGNEGEEPHDFIGDLPVQHQWAKTWAAEQDFAKYVAKCISPVIKVGSPLRKFSELKIAKLFVDQAWLQYKHQFASCNIGNYKQGQSNEVLGWCGNCPKCANSFLLFAPFVDPTELIEVFNGENLFKKASLKEIFKGLLGVDDVMKPLECVGEVDELRMAYHLANERSTDYQLPFPVPQSQFDLEKTHPAQNWAIGLI